MRLPIYLLICFALAQTGVLNSQTNQQKILFITSSQVTYGDTELKTSNHFAEIVLAYDVFVSAGYSVDFVSPIGGEIAIGYIDASEEIQNKYLSDTAFMSLLKTTKRPSQIVASDYIAVYYSGGGAAMFGVPENKPIQKISESIYKNDGIVSAICHGTAGIVNLKNDDGTFIYRKKKITGFPDKFERTNRPYYKTFPFSIENRISSNGGEFKYSEDGWDGYYLIDGRIVTGQDPSASAIVAKKVVEIIKQTK